VLRKDLDRVRDLVKVARRHVARELQDASPGRATELLDEALALLDPDRQRPLTPFGKRILEAANAVGLDAYRIDTALRGRIPAGALTRLLHHDVKQVRDDVLGAIADLIGCERAWLQFGTGEQRTRPIPPGVIAARAFGATEEAIRLVRDKYADPAWGEEEWMVAFLAMSKQIRETGVPKSDTWKVMGKTEDYLPPSVEVPAEQLEAAMRAAADPQYCKHDVMIGLRCGPCEDEESRDPRD
jgi:hypothetical protein